MRKLGSNLSTTVNVYNTSYKELNKIDKDVMRLTGRAESGFEALAIDRPHIGEEKNEQRLSTNNSCGHDPNRGAAFGNSTCLGTTASFSS